ncbi:MAG: hypothetical protein WCE61_17690 [Candidatus Acidiferrum sp.]
MKTRGRKHSAAARFLLSQVSKEFRKKKDELGAARAAKLLRVSLPSFYNYVNGDDLPKMEVLRDAQKLWGIKWEMIDPAEILKTRTVETAEQLLLPFIRSVREDDIEIVEVVPGQDSSLRVILKIQFSSEETSMQKKNRAEAKR